LALTAVAVAAVVVRSRRDVEVWHVAADTSGRLPDADEGP
jgi:hypothetical protein